MKSMEEGLISELRRDGDHATADRILAENSFNHGISEALRANPRMTAVVNTNAAFREQVVRKAEEHIKKQYMDWDHCGQSARAVHVFLRGVEWTLDQL